MVIGGFVAWVLVAIATAVWRATHGHHRKTRHIGAARERPSSLRSRAKRSPRSRVGVRMVMIDIVVSVTFVGVTAIPLLSAALT